MSCRRVRKLRADVFEPVLAGRCDAPDFGPDRLRQRCAVECHRIAELNGQQDGEHNGRPGEAERKKQPPSGFASRSLVVEPEYPEQHRSG